MPTLRGDPDAMIADLAGRPGVAGVTVNGVPHRLHVDLAAVPAVAPLGPPPVAYNPQPPAPTLPRKGGGKRQPVRTDAPRRLLIEVTVPIRLASEPNVGGRLGAKIGRKGEVKAAVRAALPDVTGSVPLPVVVTLTRHGVRSLDADNLQAAFKAVRDAVAEWVGADDADPCIRWKYRQRPAWTPHVTVRIEHKGRT